MIAAIRNADEWMQAAIVSWAILLAITCFKPLFYPVSGTIYPTYAHAGEEFAAGRRLYDVPHPHTDNFRYSPLVAASFVPFSWLPLGFGGLVWRAISDAVFITALAAWIRRVAPDVHRSILFLVAIPLSIGSLHNGQANTLVAGLLLWGTVLAANARWSAAAILIAGAVLFKIYPLSIALLFVLAAPIRFGIPLAIALAAGAALPFAMQSTEYVSDQYRYWMENLGRDDRSNFPLHAGMQDFQMLLRVVGLPLPLTEYRYVQAATGSLVGLFSARMLWKGAARSDAALDSFALGTCWIILFGPATETSTFILLAPFMARELLDRKGQAKWAWYSAICGGGLFLFARIALAMPRAIHQPIIALGVQPLAAALIATAVIGRVVTRCKTQRAKEGEQESKELKRAA